MSTILCDTEGCPERIEIHADVTELEARRAAHLAGWQVTNGARRDYHHCPNHRVTEAGTNR